MRIWLLSLAVFSGAAFGVRGADEEWTPLFNGKDLTHWKLHPETNSAFKEVKPVEVDGKKVAWEGIEKDTKDKKPGKTYVLWKVVDGTIVGGGPMSHLYHDAAQYGDFHLRAEVKIHDKGNSGIFFRAGYNGGIPKGYEAQVNATHGDPIKTGSVYPNASFGLGKDPKEKSKMVIMNTAPHKPDVWFLYEIIAKGPRIVLKVDGKEVKDWTDPDYTFKKGHIALQGHDPGSIMEFKKIEIKELK